MVSNDIVVPLMLKRRELFRARMWRVPADGAAGRDRRDPGAGLSLLSHDRTPRPRPRPRRRHLRLRPPRRPPRPAPTSPKPRVDGADDATGATPGEALADSVEEPHTVTTPDSPAENVDVSDIKDPPKK